MENETPQPKIQIQLPTWIKVVIVVGVLALGFVIFLLLRTPEPSVDNTVQDERTLDSLAGIIILRDSVIYELDKRHSFDSLYFAGKLDSLNKKLKRQRQGEIDLGRDFAAKKKKAESESYDTSIIIIKGWGK